MPGDLVPDERIYGDERRSEELVSAIRRVEFLLAEIAERPDPTFPRLDLTTLESWLKDVSTRLDLLVPPSPEGIADALARRLPQDKTPEVAASLQATTKQLERLNKKVSAMSVMPSGGSSGHVIVDSGIISSITQPVSISGAVQTTAATRETRLDYDTRLDSNPVYVGDAEPGTATSAAAWTVLKLTYDATNRLTRKQTQTNIAWDDRATGWGA